MASAVCQMKKLVSNGFRETHQHHQSSHFPFILNADNIFYVPLKVFIYFFFETTNKTIIHW